MREMEDGDVKGNLSGVINTNIDRQEIQAFSNDFHIMLQIVIFNSLGFFFLEFLIPYFANQHLNASGFDIGLLVSVQTFGYLISSLFTGFISDHMYSKKNLVFIGSLGRGISYFIIYTAILTKELILLNIGTFTLGFMAGFFWIPFNSLLSQKSLVSNRAEAFGRKDMAIGKGMFFGGLLGFTIFGIGIKNWPQFDFLVYLSIPLFGLANIIAGIVFLIKIDESLRLDILTVEIFGDNQNIIEPHEIDDGNDSINTKFVENLRKNDKFFANFISNQPKRLIIGLISLFSVLTLAAVNESIARPFINVYVLENITSDAILAMVAYIPSGIISMFVAPTVGRIVDRINPALAISISSLTGAFITFVLINTSNIWIFMLILIFDTTIAKFSGFTIQSILSKISKENRGKIFGITDGFVHIGYITGPILGGIVWDSMGFSAPFIISIFVEIILIPFYIIAIKQISPNLDEKS